MYAACVFGGGGGGWECLSALLPGHLPTAGSFPSDLSRCVAAHKRSHYLRHMWPQSSANFCASGKLKPLGRQRDVASCHITCHRRFSVLLAGSPASQHVRVVSLLHSNILKSPTPSRATALVVNEINRAMSKAGKQHMTCNVHHALSVPDVPAKACLQRRRGNRGGNRAKPEQSRQAAHELR